MAGESTLPRLTNPAARAHFLDRHLLAARPAGRLTGQGLRGIIRQLGFVQLDSVSTVERAHHMILHARATGYRPPMLARLTDRDRALFEHWTHDASVIPVEFHPMWMHRHEREREWLRARFRSWQGSGWEGDVDRVREHVRAGGPVLARDLVPEGGGKSGGWWEWHPSKAALEYLWRTGELAIVAREGFQKAYDLTERVIPDPHRQAVADPGEWLDWHLEQAMERLGFATPGELAAFWGGVSPEEAKAWVSAALKRGALEEIAVEGAGGQMRRMLARPGLSAEPVPVVAGITRILSPFDPALRDRKRAEFLFGFFFRIEIFVPAPKRRWGYYVFPVLEGARLIGRIDMKAEPGGCLRVTAFWPEAGIRMGKARLRGLEGALARTAQLAECATVAFADGWLREA